MPFRPYVKGKHSTDKKSPEFSCKRKETIDVNILITSKNGDRENIQLITITSRPLSRMRKRS